MDFSASFIFLSLFFLLPKECVCRCNHTHTTICASVEDYLKEVDETWFDVTIKSDKEVPLTSITMTNFVGLRSLTVIKQLNAIEYCDITGDVGLRYLSLYGNNMPKLRQYFFINLQLEKLVLRNNNIESIDRFTFAEDVAVDIDLSHNKLRVIEKYTFISASSKNVTKILSIINNSLVYIETASLPPSLESLRLDHNELTSADFLKFLIKLKKLTLSYNKFSVVSNTRFPQSLEVLDFSYNNIRYIGRDIFKGLKKLNMLDLSNNQLRSVDFLEPFVKSIQRWSLSVSLAFNYLKNFDSINLTKGSLLFKEIILYGNPWDCVKFHSVEKILNEITPIRNDCDLKYFGKGDLPYCVALTIDGMSEDWYLSIDPNYEDTYVNKFFQEIKTNTEEGCELSLKQNEEYRQLQSKLCVLV